MSQAQTIHWLVGGIPQCEGFDGTGSEGVEIQSPFDPNALKLSCLMCCARLLAEANQ